MKSKLAFSSSKNTYKRYLTLFSLVNLSKDFYFSYKYEISNTLQKNMSILCNVEEEGLEKGKYECNAAFTFRKSHVLSGGSERFIWNHYLLEPLMDKLEVASWMTCMIHGFLSQKTVRIGNIDTEITIVMRRSRHYAGTRYNKRGVNDRGDVANEVEIEQIVGRRGSVMDLFSHYSSYTQIRGSVPQSWTQTGDVLHPKPAIEFTNFDPTHQHAQLHFRNLEMRYGTPIQVFNLVKLVEKTPRETLIGSAFREAVTYLNKLETLHHIIYHDVDLAAAMKSKEGRLLSLLYKLNKPCLELSNLFSFRTSPSPDGNVRISVNRTQSGIARANCVDCLDRTNVMQAWLGVTVLGHQLMEIGVFDTPSLSPTFRPVTLLISLYREGGDRLSEQYGGSAAHSTQMAGLEGKKKGKGPQVLFTSIRRYYSNTFTDQFKQDGLNVFLGLFRPLYGEEVHIWDLETDIALHFTGSETLLWDIPKPVVYFHEAGGKKISKNIDFNEKFNSMNVRNGLFMFDEYFEKEPLNDILQCPYVAEEGVLDGEEIENWLADVRDRVGGRGALMSPVDLYKTLNPRRGVKRPPLHVDWQLNLLMMSGNKSQRPFIHKPKDVYGVDIRYDKDREKRLKSRIQRPDDVYSNRNYYIDRQKKMLDEALDYGESTGHHAYTNALAATALVFITAEENRKKFETYLGSKSSNI